MPICDICFCRHAKLEFDLITNMWYCKNCVVVCDKNEDYGEYICD